MVLPLVWLLLSLCPQWKLFPLLPPKMAATEHKQGITPNNNARRLVPPGESCSSSGSSRITVASVLIHDPFFQVVTSKRWRKTSTGTYSERVLLFPVASPLALLICGFYRPRHDVSSLQHTQETREESPALGNGHDRNAHFTRGFSSAKWKQSQ